tara:strand:- start:29086 stop:29295 length:210 start_codon:yes stop_codon:yes gene_type:complete
VDYCDDARKLIGRMVACDKCPIVANCPRLILEDAADKAISKAIQAMIKAVKKDDRAGRDKEWAKEIKND